MLPPFFVVESSYSYVLRFVGTSCGWWLHSYLACHCSLPVGCLLLASSAAKLRVLGMLPCCPLVVRPPFVWPRVSLPSFLSFAPAGSGCAGSCGFSSPIWFTTFAMGSPLRGRGLFAPRSEQRFSMFLFPFWAVSSCCHCPSGYGHHMGQVCWLVPTCARPTVVIGGIVLCALPFILLDGLRASV